MVESTNCRVLSSNQTEAFDTEYVHDGLWSMIENNINRDFPSGDFRFVDMGGGNGLFSDRILEQYPNSTGILIDCSETLVARNSKHPRKTIICDSLEHISDYPECSDCDLVFLNWVLHHLVSTTRDKSIFNIMQALSESSKLLNSRGRLSVFENMYDGLLLDELPSKLIYALTSNTALAPVMRRLGANTAGCGVCMLSHQTWNCVFDKTGLQVLDYADDYNRKVILAHRIFLHMGRIRAGHYWLK